MYMCVRDVDFAVVSRIFRLDFGTVDVVFIFFKSFFNRMFIGFSFYFLIVLSILLGEIIYVIYKLFSVHC